AIKGAYFEVMNWIKAFGPNVRWGVSVLDTFLLFENDFLGLFDEEWEQQHNKSRRPFRRLRSSSITIEGAKTEIWNQNRRMI
mgnify:CR=1